MLHIRPLAIIVCRLKWLCNPACTITAGTLLTSCSCGMKYVWNVTCGMYLRNNVWCISTNLHLVNKKERSSNHHSALDNSSEQQNHSGKTIFVVWKNLSHRLSPTGSFGRQASPLSDHRYSTSGIGNIVYHTFTPHLQSFEWLWLWCDLNLPANKKWHLRDLQTWPLIHLVILLRILHVEDLPNPLMATVSCMFDSMRVFVEYRPPTRHYVQIYIV